MPAQPDAIAFEDGKRFAQGSLGEIAVATKKKLARKGAGQVLMFDYATGKVLDLNLQGSEKEIAARYERYGDVKRQQADAAIEATGPRGPGRPKLGVVAREVTLLPRHWDWLSAQPGGASVALRRLVDDARKTSGGRDKKRASQEAAYRFMSAIAGDLPDYEEATRALFAGDPTRFDALVAAWPDDVREHARLLAASALASPKSAPGG